ncbi:hypothetical protein [Actinoplanes sp. NBRC 103695]|uniref:hypothetical protein n=1 Tax=Actinoplanes sp. NBRC 103695 TaxID=3032202 RepID=UPI0025562C72|nr:hypothetical protein [Actinoplanes sp. NBRC 103695]
MTELVGQRASLPHRVPAACDTDEHGTALRIPHRQTVFVRAHVEDGDVDVGRLLDQSDEVAQWLKTQTVLLPEPLGCGAPLTFGLHAGMACSSR